MHPDRKNGLLCALIVVAAVLVARPFAEMGFQDDWSYIRTALEFARTGHFVYNGWATAMLGWMIPWTAAFIKIFGFSFTTARMSLLPVTLATVYLFHQTLVRFGIRGRDAVLGTLTFGLCPAFLPLEASYMTDLPGMFAIVLCLYLCQRAVAARTDRSAALWLLSAAAGSVVGGTARQIAWLGALVMVPAAAWLLRRRAGMVRAGVVAWVASVLGIVVVLHWWNAQMYSVPEHIVQGRVSGVMVHHMFGGFAKGLLCVLLLVYPVLLAGSAPYRGEGKGVGLRVGLSLVASVIIVLSVEHFIPNLWLAPWLTHMLQSVMRGSGDIPGVVQIPWPVPAREAISVAVVGAAMAFFIAVLRARVSSGARPLSAWAERRQFFWMLVPFSVAYLALLCPRGLYGMLYDRYFLGLMPVAIVLLLKLHESQWKRPVPTACFGALTIFAAFAIAGTHDWYAFNRARIAAVSELESHGIPKTAVQAGFEFDGWTQIEAAGYVNERHIEFPANAFHKNMRMYQTPERCWYFFGWYSPAITPKYALTASEDDCYTDSPYAPIEFRTWLPPFRRKIFIRATKKPGSWPPSQLIPPTYE